MVRNLKRAEFLTARCSARRFGAVLGAAALAGVGNMLFALPAPAAEIEQAGTALSLEADKAQIVQLPEPAATVFVANPDIADVQVPAATGASSFLVLGKKTGNTTVYALSRTGKTFSYAVKVTRQTTEIAEALRRAVPQATIEVSNAPNGITVAGHVASPADAQKLRAAAVQFLGEKESLNFNVAVDAATQITLVVRVAEVQRTAAKNFGFNWGSVFNDGTLAIGLLTGRAPVTAGVNALTGANTYNFGDFVRSSAPSNLDSIGIGYQNGSVNISGLIDALQNEGLINILSQPNLTAISGETANFLAGGEFPVPVAQTLQQITIEWKRFGVSVDFTPIVIDANRISVKVRPEVSELTNVGSIQLASIQIPGLSVRRAETTVELASGQSFAIAGLFQNNVTNNIQQLPWLGDLPVLGALFRSSSFQRNESELVIFVTPYIVHPIADAKDIHLPTDGVVFASDLEQILLGRLTGAEKSRPSSTGAAPHLSGAAGFMLEQ